MADELPTCFDPYLRYAISTGFKDFVFFDARDFNKRDLKLVLLVELKDVKSADDFEKAISREAFSVEFGPADPNSRYLTMRARKAAVGPDSFRAWNDHVSRVELSLPLNPADVSQSIARAVPRDRTASKDPPTPLLIGLLDDGGPFAAAQFLKSTAGAAGGTRVRGVWDQNEKPDRTPIPVDASSVFGERSSDFGYGLEFLRDSASGGPKRQVGLDEWITLHTAKSGSIDEDGCYAEAKFNTLKRQRSHGAHVMDVIAGRVPVSARIARGDPPGWHPGTDPAASADIVFVQFPDDCIRDATGVWLKAYVLDGIRYILSFVDPSKTPNVLINISYGATTGPHDGTAELESALTELVTMFDGSSGKPKLEIFLAAGNAYLSEGHIYHVRKASTQPHHVRWTWRIPPDNTTLCFAEIWMKKHHASGVTVTLRSPSGLTFSSTSSPVSPSSGTAIPPYTGAYAPVDWGGNTMWLLAVEPTVARSAVVPEHGDWTIEVKGIGVNADVHAYVARTDPNMGVRSGARRSFFVDPGWERTRSDTASCTRRDGEFDKAGSLIKRCGTLNGIATAEDANVQVAGGYILANGRKSSYSSAGPARGGSRVGPDFVLPCDESYALQGIRAGGNRSGAVFRLIGTSTAAPQLARQFAKRAAGGSFPPPRNVPSPSDHGEIEKRGGGDLEPP